MKTSDSIKQIAAALVQAQAAITFAGKNAKNPHFKNNYADLTAVIDAVKPALNEVGIVFLQTASPSEDGRLHLTTRLLHTSGEWIEDTAVCPLPKQDPQGFGSAMTYLRRYSLASMIGLYQDDDDGEAARPRANGELTMLNKYVSAMEKAATLDELKAHYFAAIAMCNGDEAALLKLETVKDARKTALTPVPA